MEDILRAQKKAFTAELVPTLDTRVDRLNRCIALLKDYEAKIVKALQLDFKSRSSQEIIISEVDQSIRNLRFTIKSLRRWMKPITRQSSFGAGLLGAKAVMQPSPLGSVGIIAPWNFPVGMIFYPAASIFASGNRIMAKPSEITPHTADLIKEAVEKYFDPTEFFICLGGPRVGENFSKLDLDHLLYIGSNSIAKKVLLNASRNLVPTTLELGGKSPTIIGDGADLHLAAKRILFAKTVNAGQICLAPDYVFLKKGLGNDFLEELKGVFSSFYPKSTKHDYTSMVNENHHSRIHKYLDDAVSKGAKVFSLGQFDDDERNLITPKVLLNTKNSMEVMKQEIFGPLLPVLEYENLEEVVSYINSHDRPLGLYFFGNRKKDHQYIIENTRSGGITINDAVFHLLQSRLPFGGVGESGYGCYHGYEGFLNFSNLKSIYYQTKYDFFLSLVRPPRGKYFKLVSRFMNKLS